MKQVELRFAVYYRRAEFAAAADLVAAADFDAVALVSRAVTLDGVDDAFRLLLSSRTERKVVVTPGG